MTFRTASQFLSMALAFALVTTASPVSPAYAQENNGNQQDSAQEAENQSEEDQKEDQKADAVQLKVIQLEHIDYKGLTALMGLEGIGLSAGDEKVHLSHNAYAPDKVFVRAPKQKLDTIEQLVSQVDVPPDQFPRKIKHNDQVIARTVPSKVTDQALQVLEQLGYRVSVERIGGHQMLVTHSKDEQIRNEIDEVIKSFAKPEKAEEEKAKDQPEEEKAEEQPDEEQPEQQEQEGEN